MPPYLCNAFSSVPSVEHRCEILPPHVLNRKSMAHESADEDSVFLSTLPATRGARMLAAMVALTSLAVFLLAAPFAKTPLMQVWAFIPLYESALVTSDLITAALLFGQFGILRSKALLTLACAYLFTAFMTIAHALTFPGTFSAGGLLGAGPQSTAWLYMLWHGGFPLFIMAYALFKNGHEPAASRTRAGVAIAASIAAVLLLVCSLVFLVTAGHDLFPPIILNNHYTSSMLAIVSTVWSLSLLALIILWRQRRQSVLDLWLMVVMCAWLCDIALSAVLNAGRFDLGFYFGRVHGLLSASFVLVVLLLENGILYTKLVKANDSERRNAADLRQLSAKLEAVNAVLADKNQELQGAMQLKSEFLGNMSHELRTPLNAILGFTGTLLMKLPGPLNSIQERQLRTVQTGAKHLLSLINDLLDLTKIESGKVQLQREPVVCQELLEELADTLRPLADNKCLAFTFKTPQAACRIQTDRRALSQILINLVNNAIKFTPAGEVTVVLTETAVGDAAGVEFAIMDTGIGVKAEDQTRLFEAFTQLDSSSTKRVEGTGLGLHLSQKLAILLGGRISLQSEYGKGSCFMLALPQDKIHY